MDNRANLGRFPYMRVFVLLDRFMSRYFIIRPEFSTNKACRPKSSWANNSVAVISDHKSHQRWQWLWIWNIKYFARVVPGSLWSKKTRSRFESFPVQCKLIRKSQFFVIPLKPVAQSGFYAQSTRQPVLIDVRDALVGYYAGRYAFINGITWSRNFISYGSRLTWDSQLKFNANAKHDKRKLPRRLCGYRAAVGVSEPTYTFAEPIRYYAGRTYWFRLAKEANGAVSVKNSNAAHDLAARYHG